MMHNVLPIQLVHSMNMVESIFWSIEDWKGKHVGVVPRVRGQHQVGWCCRNTQCVSSAENLCLST